MKKMILFALAVLPVAAVSAQEAAPAAISRLRWKRRTSPASRGFHKIQSHLPLRAPRNLPRLRGMRRHGFQLRTRQLSHRLLRRQRRLFQA